MNVVDFRNQWTHRDEVRSQLAVLKKASQQLNLDFQPGRPLFGTTIVEPHGYCEDSRTAVFFHSDGLIPGYPHRWSGPPTLGDLVNACSIEPPIRVVALALDPAGTFNAPLIEKIDHFGLDVEVGILRN